MPRVATVVVSLIAIHVLPSVARAATKVACVGDSITQNSGWCEALGTKLGANYTASNFGVSGTTLMKAGDSPYWTCNQFTPSHDFAPNIVVIMLGTNDSKPQNWSKKANFVADYEALIDSYTSLSSSPKIYACLPPPAGTNSYSISGTVIANEVLPLVRQAATNKNVPTIDIFTAFGGSNFDASLFGSAQDQVHPNAKGAQVICDTVYAALTVPSGTGGTGSGGTSNGSTTGSGGRSNSGGTTSSGGNSYSGGTKNTGGLSNTAGVTSSGGQSSTSGNSNSSGTKNTGGQSNVGGSTSSGGTKNTGGLSSTGGATSSGGTKNTGGTTSLGGDSTSGGTHNTGGQPSAGGLSSFGGNAITAGQSSTDRQASAGDTGLGGNGALGGNPSTAPATVVGSSATQAPESSGCGCRTAERTHRDGGWIAFLFAAMVFRRGKRTLDRVRCNPRDLS